MATEHENQGAPDAQRSDGGNRGEFEKTLAERLMELQGALNLAARDRRLSADALEPLARNLDSRVSEAQAQGRPTAEITTQTMDIGFGEKDAAIRDQVRSTLEFFGQTRETLRHMQDGSYGGSRTLPRLTQTEHESGASGLYLVVNGANEPTALCMPTRFPGVELVLDGNTPLNAERHNNYSYGNIRFALSINTTSKPFADAHSVVGSRPKEVIEHAPGVTPDSGSEEATERVEPATSEFQPDQAIQMVRGTNRVEAGWHVVSVDPDGMVHAVRDELEDGMMATKSVPALLLSEIQKLPLSSEQ